MVVDRLSFVDDRRSRNSTPCCERRNGNRQDSRSSDLCPSDLRLPTQAIIAAINAVPSSLGVSIDVMNLDTPVELVSRLRRATKSVIDQCIRAITMCEDDLAVNEDSTFPVRGFENEIHFIVS